MSGTVFEFEYFWVILLVFILERICCLHEQIDKDFCILPDPRISNDSLDFTNADFVNRDFSLKLSFLRLYRMMYVTMIFALTYFCNICFWFIMAQKASTRTLK